MPKIAGALVGLGVAATAGAQTVLPSSVAVPWGPAETLYESFTYVAPGSTQDAVRFGFSGVGGTDTTAGAKTWKLWYQVYDPQIGQFDTIRPLIQSGGAYSQTHPIEPVYIEPPTRQNSFMVSASPPTTGSNQQILVPFYYWPLNGNDLVHPEAESFTKGGVLIGTWNANHSDVAWTLGLTSGLDYNTASRRGEMEPSVAELSQPGHLLMSMRGSNTPSAWYQQSLAGRAWYATSDDYGQTWSGTRKMTYSDGTDFYSPSSMSSLVRNDVDGKLYWIGNISPANPNGNSPRYPLVIAQVDEQNMGLIKGTVQTLVTRDPGTQSTAVQFSNFQIGKSPVSGELTVRAAVYDGGNFLGYKTYVTNLGIAAPTVTPPSPESVPWTFRYEGNVLPAAAGAIHYSNGDSGQFTQAGSPNLSTDGQVLHFGQLSGSNYGFIRSDTVVPSGTGAIMNLDPSVGYTVEFRARLNGTSNDGFGAASVQIANGTSTYTISLGDVNGTDPGYVLDLSTTHDQIIAMPDGFHTFRFTAKDTAAALYVDGLLALTDFTGADVGDAPTWRLQLGDLTGGANADWDLDYLYAYDGGAVPVPEPALAVVAALAGCLVLSGRRRPQRVRGA
jgi:hypothetical protein